MAVTHLVDTSVLTRLQTSAVRDRVASELLQGRLARSAITDLEVGFSARSAREWDELLKAVREFVLVPVTQDELQRALDVQRLLASSGHRGRKLPDLIVAAVAERNHLIVLHYDRDFELIAAETGQACEWVVPRGSID